MPHAIFACCFFTQQKPGLATQSLLTTKCPTCTARHTVLTTHLRWINFREMRKPSKDMPMMNSCHLKLPFCSCAMMLLSSP